jgi:hypothetical protein
VVSAGISKYKIMKANTENQPVIVTVPPATVTRYLEASEEVEQTLGRSPGPEFLMSLAVEHEDPLQLVDLFCGEIIEALRETPAAIH